MLYSAHLFTITQFTPSPYKSMILTRFNLALTYFPVIIHSGLYSHQIQIKKKPSATPSSPFHPSSHSSFHFTSTTSPHHSNKVLTTTKKTEPLQLCLTVATFYSGRFLLHFCSSSALPLLFTPPSTISSTATTVSTPPSTRTEPVI